MTNNKPPIHVDKIDLFWTVTPLKLWSGSTKVADATGFFWENADKIFLITNRHVVIGEDEQYYPDRIEFRVDRGDQVGYRQLWLSKALYRQNTQPVWMELCHKIDIVAIELDPVIKTHKIRAFSSGFVTPDELVVDLGSDVSVIGYPLGFYDRVHNLPVIRNGAVASNFWVEFEEKPYFLIDARLHPGTSGGPVILKPTYTMRYKDGSAFDNVGGPGTFLLGVNSDEWSVEGQHLGLNTVWHSGLIEKLTLA